LPKKAKFMALVTKGAHPNETNIKVYHWVSFVEVYSFKTELKILEVSFSCLKLENENFKHRVSMALLDDELRVHYITNAEDFDLKDTILEVHSYQNLYDKELLGHTTALKIDLAPKLKPE
jgi:hypothetical protein